MPTLTFHIVADIALLALAVAVRVVTVNRLVQRKLLLTLIAGFASLAASALRVAGLVPPDLVADVTGIDNLLAALAAINFVVVVSINPLREDRIPGRFPNIVQDAIIVGLFLVVATAVLQEKFLTTSAVGAVVVGFALQDTLGNAFAGLAIQTEKPYRAGQWIRVGEHEGRVEEITWRATKLRTKAGTFVIVPNNVMSKEAIVNFSEPIIPTRMFIDVGASYHAPPNEVKAAIAEAMRNAPLVLALPEPDVVLLDFGPSAVTYRARFWIDDYARDEPARSQVRTSIWYVFRRRNIEIPWPIQVQYGREEVPGRSPDTTPRIAASLAQVELLQSLTDADRLELAALCDGRLYAAHEVVVRQDAPGNSMFVVSSGKVEIVLEPDGRPLAVTGAGGFFGEMSLLTGSPRTATVRALEDCTLVELTSEAFRRFVLEKPAVLDVIAAAVMKRRGEIDQRRSETATPAAPAESATSFLGRIRKFLRIPT
ncbi:MAG: mechanosensitive ion channel family protein [Acidobacteria bacterium]|nr:mechanosensitive ion channel family protein [Acidobacteriota bacterium]